MAKENFFKSIDWNKALLIGGGVLVGTLVVREVMKPSKLSMKGSEKAGAEPESLSREEKIDYIIENGSVTVSVDNANQTPKNGFSNAVGQELVFDPFLGYYMPVGNVKVESPKNVWDLYTGADGVVDSGSANEAVNDAREALNNLNDVELTQAYLIVRAAKAQKRKKVTLEEAAEMVGVTPDQKPDFIKFVIPALTKAKVASTVKNAVGQKKNANVSKNGKNNGKAARKNALHQAVVNRNPEAVSVVSNGYSPEGYEENSNMFGAGAGIPIPKRKGRKLAPLG